MPLNTQNHVTQSRNLMSYATVILRKLLVIHKIDIGNDMQKMQCLNIKSVPILIKFYMIMIQRNTKSICKTQIISKIHLEFFSHLKTKIQGSTQILVD